MFRSSARLGPRVTPVDRQIRNLAVPALGALVAEPLFLLADSVIVSGLGPGPLAALGLAAAVMATAANAFVFLTYASTASVARRCGAGQTREAWAAGTSALWLAGLIGVLGALALLPAAGWIAGRFAGTPTVITGSTHYLRWALPGLPAMLVVMAAIGVLRGVGRPRVPLLVLAGGAVANAGLNLVLVRDDLPLVGGAGLGLVGSAIGTTLTQVAMAVIGAAAVVQGARAAGAAVRPRRAGLLDGTRSGLPLLVRTLALRATLLSTTAVAAAVGTVGMAAHHLAATVWSLAAFTLDALAIAGQTLIGQALGAGDRQQARSVLIRLVQWGLLAGAGLGLVMVTARHQIAALLSADPAVQDSLAAVLVVAGAAQPLAGLVFVLDGVLIGAGDGRYLAAAAIVQFALYLPLAAAIGRYAEPGTQALVLLWTAFAGEFMAARALLLGLRARTERWMVLGGRR